MGNLLNIHGSVDVRNTTPSTALVVDDTTDPGAHPAVSLSDTALLGLAPAAITYQKSGLGVVLGSGFEGLDVRSSNGADTITVTNTPGFTSIGLGKGPHRLNVEGLTEALNIGPNVGFGATGQTTVVVGSNPSGTGGTQANIHGQLAFDDLGSGSGTSNVVVDDSGDATPRTVSLTASGIFSNNTGNITGLAPGANVRFIDVISSTNLIINGAVAEIPSTSPTPSLGS